MVLKLILIMYYLGLIRFDLLFSTVKSRLLFIARYIGEMSWNTDMPKMEGKLIM